MNLPTKWNNLPLQNCDKNYLVGFDYSKDSFHYSVYITDLSKVWICDVDEQKLRLKITANGIEDDFLGKIYISVVDSFERNFSSSNPDEVTKIELEELKKDNGTPLELQLKLKRIYERNHTEFAWSFELNILPDSSAISILKNLIFHLSTIISSFNLFKDDLCKVIEWKDMTIRFLYENMKTLSGGEQILSKWAPENSFNSKNLSEFDISGFEESWKDKKLATLQNRYIWDILNTNTMEDTWSFGTGFELNRYSKAMEPKLERKRVKYDTNDSDDNDDFVDEENKYESKKRKVEVEHLSQELDNYDIKPKDNDTDDNDGNPKFKTSTKPSIDVTTDRNVKPDETLTPENHNNTTTPEEVKNASGTQMKSKRRFGASRKRRVGLTSSAPIKAPRRF